jgi:hypothetical protein
MTRNSRVQFSLASILMLMSAYLVAQQTSKPQAAPDPLTEPVKVTATIEAIDRSARLITLKGPRGNLVTVRADENMKRFDELKVGDSVTATYYESIAVHVRKPGDPAPAPTGGAVTPDKGAAPGATAAVQQTVTVTVEAIDRANQSVTVKRQDGGIVSFRVQNPKYLDMAKAGDTVDITYTQALLVGVTPAK